MSNGLLAANKKHREQCGICHRMWCEHRREAFMRRFNEMMAEEVMAMSDEEIRAEVMANGEDPDEIAARMRRDIDALLAKVKP